MTCLTENTRSVLPGRESARLRRRSFTARHNDPILGLLELEADEHNQPDLPMYRNN